ncbi:MAG: cytochrome c biogenesis protein CcdA [Anaerolineaceae bacterium]|nr:cytochrome c biogenesis protein CcdA [Anaerolineaceae bacterium]
MNISIGLAFLAGLASFLSPCVFSLVPAYIGYLSGRSIAALPTEDLPIKKRLITLGHGLAFVLGFSMVFITLGMAASTLGRFLGDFVFGLRDILPKIGGVIVIIFGLHLTGLLRIPFLDYDLRPKNRYDEQIVLFSSLLMGIFFSAGWSPCVGPVLGAILTLAVNEGATLEGAKLLSAYSMGLAIPFLLAAVGVGWVVHLLRRFRKLLHYVEVGMGVLLIIVGIMLFLGTFQTLSSFGSFIDLGL